MPASATAAIHYRIDAFDPYAHLYRIQLDIALPDPAGQLLRLPAWIPGSYMIRDFARNITQISAAAAGIPVELRKIDKSTWQLPPLTAPVTVTYCVYAWDLSVRAAHLDQKHAYFNGSSVFLEVVGQAGQPCTLDIEPPRIPEAQHWRVATSLPEAGARRYGFGRYRADNYADLIDHPVEIADFSLVSFDACGVPHDFVLTGLHNADLPRIARDLKLICEYQIKLFGEPAPFARYVFITWVVGDGYGGLEHRASTSLICSRDDLPLAKNADSMSDGYRTYLGLCSHEYFHSWNVKRIAPAIPYDLAQENHTPLLWAFEGITSYYDDLVLVRTGLISPADYLDMLGKTITRILRNPGRLQQSVADSSFDAWTKFYKQDENSANAIVSYYTKGSLVALGLDLLLRQVSDQQVTFDDVMRALWQRHGLTGIPVQEHDIQHTCARLLQEKNAAPAALELLQQFCEHAIYSSEELQLEEWLRSAGVEYALRKSVSMSDSGGSAGKNADRRPDLGISSGSASHGASVTRVLNGSAAHRAGISAGDVLIAIDNVRVDNGSLEKVLNRYQPGDVIDVHSFRRDELMQFRVTLAEPALDTCYLTIIDEETVRRWLQPQSLQPQ